MRSQLPGLGLVMMVYGVLLALLGVTLWCSSPVALMEGEELPVLFLGLVWGAAMVACGLLVSFAGSRVRRGRGRVLALVALLVQAPVSFCFCALPSLFLLLWGGFLLLIDKDAVDAFEHGFDGP